MAIYDYGFLLAHAFRCADPELAILYNVSSLSDQELSVCLTFRAEPAAQSARSDVMLDVADRVALPVRHAGEADVRPVTISELPLARVARAPEPSLATPAGDEDQYGLIDRYAGRATPARVGLSRLDET
jgi:hypothetical protein